MAGIKDTAISNKQLAASHGKESNRKKPRKPSRTPRVKARRRVRRIDDSDRVTTFPEVKGKVVREVRFSHHDPENILAIAFKDRTVLVFEVDPEPLVLPLDIRAHYIGETPQRVQDLGGAGSGQEEPLAISRWPLAKRSYFGGSPGFGPANRATTFLERRPRGGERLPKGPRPGAGTLDADTGSGSVFSN